MMVDRRWPTCISFAMLGDEKSTTTLDTVPKEKINKRQQSLPHRMCLIWVLLGGGEGRLASADPHTLFCCQQHTQQQRRPSGDTRAGFQPGALLHLPGRGSGITPRPTLARHAVPREPCPSPTRDHTRYIQPMPWPPVPQSYPIYSAVTTS